MAIHRLKFEDLGEQLPVSKSIKAKFQIYFEDIWKWVSCNYQDRALFRRCAVNKVNLLVYYLTVDGDVPSNWKHIVSSVDFSDVNIGTSFDQVERRISYVYMSDRLVDWSSCRQDVQEGENGCSEYAAVKDCTLNEISETSDVDVDSVIKGREEAAVAKETPKEDLFIITAPQYPCIGPLDKRYHNIHVSFPAVPAKQSDISVTTRVECMSNTELMRLYPNQFIRTRSPLMYKPRSGITLDPDYGLLIPVQGFTDAQVRDNIIRYPHIFQLARVMNDGTFKGFYSNIEIDGELLDTVRAWRYLPEAKILNIDNLDTKQDQIEFIKEYVIRRYLLERDVQGVKHKYSIRGELPEFVTLFMPYDMYEREGYNNPLELARTCVSARVSYLKSRNPRLNGPAPTVDDCVFSAYCCASICDRSCTKWAQMSYLMMRNELTSSSRPFQMKKASLHPYIDAYEKGQGKTSVLVVKDAVRAAEAMAYVCVCNQWKGSAMRVRAYHLLFSKYVESVQASWSGGKTEDVEYMGIWAKSSSALVVSGIDYINFKDFQCQLLLQLIQDRERQGKSTFIISPNIDNLAGNGKMYALLISKLKQHAKMLDA